jgi:hypothetical protein
MHIRLLVGKQSRYYLSALSRRIVSSVIFDNCRCTRVIHVYRLSLCINGYHLMSNKPNPLPLEETLRDLAILRAADIDSSELVTRPAGSVDPEETDEYKSVVQSYEFVKEARKAMKISHRGGVEKQGERVEEVRSKLEDVLAGLEKNGIKCAFFFLLLCGYRRLRYHCSELPS